MKCAAVANAQFVGPLQLHDVVFLPFEWDVATFCTRFCKECGILSHTYQSPSAVEVANVETCGKLQRSLLPNPTCVGVVLVFI